MEVVATVLTACGIETSQEHLPPYQLHMAVATVLTACGIETIEGAYASVGIDSCNSTYRLRY